MDADGDEEMADSTPVFGMTRCTRRQCVTCMSRLCMDNFVENKVTLQQFPISFNGTCRTSNCIYVIKCTHPNCNYQYVGHTINPINIRISHHICSILKGRGKRGIKVTGALRSAGFQKNPARPQIVFNRFTGLNMLV